MPLGEIAGEVITPIFKFIARIFLEIFVELLVRGLGYLICRPFSKKIEPDDFLVLLVGLVSWGLIIGLISFILSVTGSA